ncbi:MAG: hypothetical protein ACXVCS_03195, partial [Bdellovibrionota bacterium]
MKWMILLLAVSSSAHAAPAEPKAVVQEIFARASAPEVATDVKKQAEVNAFVDFDALAKAALGKQFK